MICIVTSIEENYYDIFYAQLISWGKDNVICMDCFDLGQWEMSIIDKNIFSSSRECGVIILVRAMIREYFWTMICGQKWVYLIFSLIMIPLLNKSLSTKMKITETCEISFAR